MPATLMSTIRNYAETTRKAVALKAAYDALIAQQTDLLVAIGKAEADNNKAREALLQMATTHTSGQK